MEGMTMLRKWLQLSLKIPSLWIHRRYPQNWRNPWKTRPNPWQCLEKQVQSSTRPARLATSKSFSAKNLEIQRNKCHFLQKILKISRSDQCFSSILECSQKACQSLRNTQFSRNQDRTAKFAPKAGKLVKTAIFGLNSIGEVIQKSWNRTKQPKGAPQT